jgi:hypothetical protein
MNTTRVLIFLTAVALAHADTIELTYGSKVEGKVHENNVEAKTVTLQFLLART